jgi:hypothetical protein
LTAEEMKEYRGTLTEGGKKALIAIEASRRISGSLRRCARASTRRLVGP